MSLKPPSWPQGTSALAFSVVGGTVCTICHFGIPGFGLPLHGGLANVRFMACATVAFASILYAWFIDEEPPCSHQRISRLHLIPTGIFGGIASVLMFSVHPSVEALGLAAVVGALLSVTGVLGVIARGL